MSRVDITSGICGFTASVQTRMEGRQCVVLVESECDAIQRLGEEINAVDPYQEISFRGEGPLALKLGAKHCYHPACPVPVGIIKAVEVEAGLALPADAHISVKGRED